MNNKGFTLVEVLAVVVILSLVMFFGGRSVMIAIENSKLKSEEVFVQKIDEVINDYLDYVMFNGGNFVESNNFISFDKCYGSCKDDEYYEAKAYLLKKNSDEYITLSDLEQTNLISSDDLINPYDDYECGSENQVVPNIYLFKDSDYVYYYFVDLRNYCNIGDRKDNSDNYVGIINTFPEDFCNGNVNFGQTNDYVSDVFNRICNIGD